MKRYLLILVAGFLVISKNGEVDASFLPSLFQHYTGRGCEYFTVANTECNACQIYRSIENSECLNDSQSHNPLEFTHFILTIIIWDNLNVNQSDYILNKITNEYNVDTKDLSWFLSFSNLNNTIGRIGSLFSLFGYSCQGIKLLPKRKYTDNKKFFQILSDVSTQFYSCLGPFFQIAGLRHDDHTTSNSIADENSSVNSMGILSSFVSWFLISLLGLTGLLLIPLRKYERTNIIILELLTGLGFGTLAGDAIYHLIPHSLGLHTHHDHSEHNHIEDTPHHDVEQLGKLTVLICGMIFFYLIEVFVKTCPLTKGKPCSCHSHTEESEDTHHHHSKGRKVVSNSPHPSHHKDPVPSIPNDHRVGYGMQIPFPVDKKCCKECDPSSDEANYLHQSLEQVEQIKSSEPSFINSAVLVLLLGDMFHHVFDGLAIGATFTSSWPKGFHEGLSTSIAIACHELPHTISDTIFLVQKGYSTLRATIIVFCTSCVSLIGVIIGVVTSSHFKNASTWINMFTAGMFLYIALVLMMSQMIDTFIRKKGPILMFLCPQMLGVILGLSIMLLIARYEDQIVV